MSGATEVLTLSQSNAEEIAQRLRGLLVGKKLRIPINFGGVEEGRLINEDNEAVSIFRGTNGAVTVWLNLPSGRQSFASYADRKPATFTFYHDKVTIEHMTIAGRLLSGTYEVIG